MFEPAEAALVTCLGKEKDFVGIDPTRLVVPLQGCNSNLSTFGMLLIIKEVLPERYSLRQLYNYLTDATDDKVLCSILVINSCLQLPERIIREPADSEDAQNLLTWLSGYAGQTAGLLRYDNLSRDKKVAKGHITLKHLQAQTEIVFETIKCLDTRFIARGTELDQGVLLSWIAYTDVEDSWTTKPLQEEVENLLTRHQAQSLTSGFIVDYVLTGFIRPLFSKSKTPVVTLQGRKAINTPLIDHQQQNDMDLSARAWRYCEIHAVAVLRWAIRHMDETMIYKSWHLCIPPLLTLLDEASSFYRARGLQILIDILSKTPTKVLQQTGLGEVFEDAVFPTLLFLPNVTPLEESLRMLEPAYFALFKLGEVRFPTKKDQFGKTKLLDRLMREGILQTFLHCSENVAIVEFLLPQLNNLINSMGIHAVKHLKDVVPMLSNILTDPFGSSHPGLLLGASKVMQAVIINCWPRMSESIYCIELIKSLSLCWTGIDRDSNVTNEPQRASLEVIKHELKISFMVLVKSLEGRRELTKEVEPLMKVAPELKLLFELDDATYIATRYN